MNNLWDIKAIAIRIQHENGSQMIVWLTDDRTNPRPYFLSPEEMIVVGEWMIEEGKKHVSQ